jgi:hypothetical protein
MLRSEFLVLLPAGLWGQALLIVGNEVSGTTNIFGVTPLYGALP